VGGGVFSLHSASRFTQHLLHASLSDDVQVAAAMHVLKSQKGTQQAEEVSDKYVRPQPGFLVYELNVRPPEYNAKLQCQQCNSGIKSTSQSVTDACRSSTAVAARRNVQRELE
jgi:hypothetical protein